MANTAKNAWMNHVSTRMIHEAEKEGKTFYNISFPYADSKTGYASVSVSAGQVRPATKKDGTVVETTRNILLGDPAKTRQVSVCTDAAAKTYAKVELTNEQIVEAYETARKAYKEAQKAAATAPAEA